MKCRITGEQVDHCAGDCAHCDQVFQTTEKIINRREKKKPGAAANKETV